MKIVKISALWCSGCLIMNKAFKELKTKYPMIEFIDYDLDLDEEEVKKYDIGNNIPVIIFIKNNKEMDRLTGELKKEEIINKIEELS